MKQWHRILGVSVATAVRPRPFQVITEYELSRLAQRLDLVVVLIEGQELTQREWPELPDGLTDLVEFNLLTYKAVSDTLSLGAIWEHVSNFVTPGASHTECSTSAPRTPRCTIF